MSWQGIIGRIFPYVFPFGAGYVLGAVTSGRSPLVDIIVLLLLVILLKKLIR